MSLMGACMCGGIGLFIGGPLGGIIGAAVGSSWGSKNDDAERKTNISQQEQKQIVFFTSVFSMLAFVAKSDGVVTKDELLVVEKFIKEELELDSDGRIFAIKIFNEARKGSDSVYDYASQFAKYFSDDNEMRKNVFTLLFKLSMADGVLHEKENEILENLNKSFGLDGSFYEYLKSGYNSSSNGSKINIKKYYAILECDEVASNAEIKKAYRMKCNDYHPDKLASKGLPEGFHKFANEQLVMINEAYQIVKKSRPSWV